MNDQYCPFPIVNLVVDFIDQNGQWQHNGYQAPLARDPFIAAGAVYEMLIEHGFTVAHIAQVMGDYTLAELNDISDHGKHIGPLPPMRCLFLDPEVAKLADT